MKYLLFTLLGVTSLQSMESEDFRFGLKHSVMPVQINARNAGTAFAVSFDHLVTAAHVCDREIDEVLTVEDRIPVWRRYSRDADICVMYLPAHGYQPLTIARSTVKRGAHVWIYGGPLGIPDILTEGYASDHEHVDLGRYSGERRRFSAPAYGGNSGGPIVNDQGQVIGILVAGIRSYPHVSYGSTHQALVFLVQKWTR